jgi:hypothetical protein
VLTASPSEVQLVKGALTRDPNNVGVGVIHLPAGQVHLLPFDNLPYGGGHAELVQILGVSLSDCRGFLTA